MADPPVPPRCVCVCACAAKSSRLEFEFEFGALVLIIKGVLVSEIKKKNQNPK